MNKLNDIRITDYNPELPSIEFTYITPSGVYKFDSSYKALEEVIHRLKKKEPISMKEEHLNAIKTIIANGGLEWVKKQVNLFNVL